MSTSTSVCNQSPYLTPPPPPPQLNFPPPSSYSFQQPSPEHSSGSSQTTVKEEIKREDIKREERSPSPYSPSRPCEDDDEQPTFSVDSKGEWSTAPVIGAEAGANVWTPLPMPMQQNSTLLWVS
jgi:hypothetical protein